MSQTIQSEVLDLFWLLVVMHMYAMCTVSILCTIALDWGSTVIALSYVNILHIYTGVHVCPLVSVESLVF